MNRSRRFCELCHRLSNAGSLWCHLIGLNPNVLLIGFSCLVFVVVSVVTGVSGSFNVVSIAGKKSAAMA